MSDLVRVCENDNFVVDYDKSRGMYRFSTFENNHFQDEYWFDGYEEKEIPDKNDRPQKHGHWFLLDECANEGVYCSACHKKVYRKDYANQKLKSKFCPNCGAIMDEPFEKLWK